jgi:15-cis-phytoene synthase
MNVEEALVDCEATVRRADPDRYFATLFAPMQKRPLLFALYAFNREIVHATEMTREPMMAEIRLQWWREAVQEARESRPRAQPTAMALAHLLAHAPACSVALEALIDARVAEVSGTLPGTLAALESHADRTSGAMMRIAAHLLGPNSVVDELAREAGIAYGLGGIILSVPLHVARGKFFAHDAIAARTAIAGMSEAARSHLARARRMRTPKEGLAAILPAALVPSYLSRADRLRDPLHERIEISPLRRQLVLLRAALLGHL